MQRVAVCCSALQCVAVCWFTYEWDMSCINASYCKSWTFRHWWCSVFHISVSQVSRPQTTRGEMCVSCVCCSVLQCCSVCCSDVCFILKLRTFCHCDNIGSNTIVLITKPQPTAPQTHHNLQTKPRQRLIYICATHLYVVCRKTFICAHTVVAKPLHRRLITSSKQNRDSCVCVC